VSAGLQNADLSLHADMRLPAAVKLHADLRLVGRFVGLASLLVIALTACKPAQNPAAADSSVEADSASIRTEAEAWFKAIDAKDLEKTLSFYASDAQYLSAGRPAATTADARRKLWIEDFGTPGFSSDEATTQIEVARSGDLAYQRGTYVATMQNERGQMTSSPGKFVVVWKKQSDHRWKAIIDIDNADQ
jgi:ketosteroid isomerase-like protein